MIKKLKYATIADIGIYDLVYYEDLDQKERVKFAKAKLGDVKTIRNNFIDYQQYLYN